MYFTQDDYRKIEEWLQKRAVKDSDLKEVSYIDGTERIPLIQEGKNCTVMLNYLLKRLSSMNSLDFVNVSDLTGCEYTSIKEVSCAVPDSMRKLGLVITYCTKEKVWAIYQFKGESLNQWNSPYCWESVFEKAVGEFVNHPDEEDLTGVVKEGKTYLRFKDRAYDPTAFSGKGEIILRRNFIGREVCSLDEKEHFENILTQDMMRGENTVYIIRYDFDLDGKSLVVPEESVLMFQGGTVNNGSLYLQNTPVYGVMRIQEMGNARILGEFGKGQIMAFQDNSYKKLTEEYFEPSTKSSSASAEEDPRQDREICYVESPNAYSTQTRQELRWWNGEKWVRVLDTTDYEELKSLIEGLIVKHDTEMSYCYKYFKIRCHQSEGRIDTLEGQGSAEEVLNRLIMLEGQVNTIGGTVNTLSQRVSALETAD